MKRDLRNYRIDTVALDVLRIEKGFTTRGKLAAASGIDDSSLSLSFRDGLASKRTVDGLAKALKVPYYGGFEKR